MLKRWLAKWRVVIAALILAFPVSYAMSDYTMTAGSGLTVFSFTCVTSKICPGSVLMTSAGVEISPATAALQTTGNTSLGTIATNTTNAATTTLQTTGNSSLSTIATNTTGASTAANQTSGNTKLDSILAALLGSLPGGSATIGNAVPAPTASSSLALTPVVCGSAVSSCVFKNAAGNFYGAYAECTAACWLMVFNSASAPSNGSTTAGTGSGNMFECIAIPAHDQRSVTYPTFPVAASVGITAVISSTECASLTLATTGFIKGTVQ